MCNNCLSIQYLKRTNQMVFYKQTLFTLTRHNQEANQSVNQSVSLPVYEKFPEFIKNIQIKRASILSEGPLT